MTNSIGNQIIIVAVTFLFTSVLGGVFASYFQNRTWRHQNQVRMAESERILATKVFENINSLMDRRLYRMRQLNWKIRDDLVSREALEEAMASYRDVLFEWNDNINRNLALVQCYFGSKPRKFMEGIVFEKFKEIGAYLEQGYRDKVKSGDISSFKKRNSNITELRDDVYRMNVMMIERIQKGEVGIFNSDTGIVPRPPLIDS